jgi:hypothetical protein
MRLDAGARRGAGRLTTSSTRRWVASKSQPLLMGDFDRAQGHADQLPPRRHRRRSSAGRYAGDVAKTLPSTHVHGLLQSCWDMRHRNTPTTNS